MNSPTEPQEPFSRPGRYDAQKRRRMVRGGRQAGGSIYISSQELEKAGFTAGGPLPYYRVWAGRRGGLVIRLYREP